MMDGLIFGLTDNGVLLICMYMGIGIDQWIQKIIYGESQGGLLGAVLGANIGTTGTIWLAGLLVSDGMPTGITRHIAMVHTGVNLLMAVVLLPFANQIARLVSRF